jgi:uncharacterized membrane protein YebE (DUF533 family)
MTQNISESRFYMWRGVVAIAHADGVVTPHEVSFINDFVKDRAFSKEQLNILGQDLQEPQHAYDMFTKITDRQDKTDFFSLARALSWCDGDYDDQEKVIIDRLEKENLISENKDILNESREILNEIELRRNQWNFKTERSKKLFGFLGGFKTASA